MGKITVINNNGLRLEVSDTIPEAMLSEMGFAILKREAVPDDIKIIVHSEDNKLNEGDNIVSEVKKTRGRKKIN